jgi:hypothetical protein
LGNGADQREHEGWGQGALWRGSSAVQQYLHRIVTSDELFKRGVVEIVAMQPLAYYALLLDGKSPSPGLRAAE